MLIPRSSISWWWWFLRETVKVTYRHYVPDTVYTFDENALEECICGNRWDTKGFYVSYGNGDPVPTQDCPNDYEYSIGYCTCTVCKRVWSILSHEVIGIREPFWKRFLERFQAE
jgi:hypothetical protein